MGLISRVSSRTYRFEYKPQTNMPEQKSTVLDVSGKHNMCNNPDFGATVGGFVKHHLAECQNSLHVTRGGASSMLFGSTIFALMIFNMPARGGMRTVAMPSRGGFVSNTISKLPKQF